MEGDGRANERTKGWALVPDRERGKRVTLMSPFIDSGRAHQPPADGTGPLLIN